mmetsp:Transcript_18061/g.39473  ORF Transcript_18061/g.39473 Transcript_18061/m.39473 type:complete len:218 (-) Transcript_18061:463-1116(-)
MVGRRRVRGAGSRKEFTASAEPCTVNTSCHHPLGMNSESPGASCTASGERVLAARLGASTEPAEAWLLSRSACQGSGRTAPGGYRWKVLTPCTIVYRLSMASKCRREVTLRPHHTLRCRTAARAKNAGAARGSTTSARKVRSPGGRPSSGSAASSLVGCWLAAAVPIRCSSSPAPAPGSSFRLRATHPEGREGSRAGAQSSELPDRDCTGSGTKFKG